MKNTQIFFAVIEYPALFDGSWIKQLIYSTKRNMVGKYLSKCDKEKKKLIFQTEIKTGGKEDLKTITQDSRCNFSLNLDT